MGASTVFLAVPTYNGIPNDSSTMQTIRTWQSRLRARGGALSFAPLKGCSVIGRARAELVTWFLNSRECYDRMFGGRGTAKSPTQDVRDFDPDNIDKHDVFVFLDDDVWGEREDCLDRLLALLEAGADIASAPALQRGNGRPNFIPAGEPIALDTEGFAIEPFVLGRERVVECSVTGFGCVAIKRAVLERMTKVYENTWNRSIAFPGMKTWGMFNPIIIQGSPEDPNSRWQLDDDYSWSQRALKAGFRIHAAIDIATLHRGERCAVGEEYDRALREQGGRLLTAP